MHWESQIGFRTLAETANDAIIVADSRGEIIFWNKGAKAIFGYEDEEVLGKSLTLLMPERYAEAHQRGLKRMCSGGKPRIIGKTVELNGLKKDGSEFPLELSLAKYKTEGRVFFTGIIRDITDRKQTEEALREETSFKELLQKVAVSANGSLTVEEALQVCLDRVCALTKWPIGHAYMASKDRPVLEPTDVWHLNEPERFRTFRQVTMATPLALGVGLPGRVMETAKPAWITDVTKDPNFPRAKLAKDIGIKAGFAFPVLVGKEVVAVLEFFSAKIEQPDERLLDVMAHIGTQLGRVIERKRAEEALQMREERLRSIVETANDAIITANGRGNMISWNRAAEIIFGYTAEEAVGKPIALIMPERFHEAHQKGIERVVSIGKTKLIGRTVELVGLRKDGTEFPTELSLAKWEMEGRVFFTGIIRDITDRKQAEERINYSAYHDALTDLPNRMLFMDRLNQALTRAPWHKRLVAILFLDLDNFKRINDTLGHSMGDLLLKAVAQQLTACVREGDTVARLGGDEFTIILTDVAQPQDVPKVARKILDAVSKPFELKAHQLFIASSIGISLYPNDGEDAETLLKNADTAMYRAKEQGRNNYQYYSPAMNVRTLERLVLESSLCTALERKEFLLHYQPQVDLKTGQIIGMEALVRWQSPDRGLVSPAQFIPLAEETGLIIPIGEWVLRTACAQGKAWQEAGLPPVRVAVNLSARQFQQSDLIETINRVLEETDHNPRYLEFELTESIMQNREAIRALSELKEMGIHISIDDFGTGYSSLSYLKHLPIQRLKIDQSFVRDITTDPNDAAIVKAIITLAHGLGLKVIAEAVETKEQLEFLRSTQCDEIQGYLISRPLPAEEATKLLVKKRGQATFPLPFAD